MSGPTENYNELGMLGTETNGVSGSDRNAPPPSGNLDAHEMDHGTEWSFEGQVTPDDYLLDSFLTELGHANEVEPDTHLADYLSTMVEPPHDPATESAAFTDYFFAHSPEIPSKITEDRDDVPVIRDGPNLGAGVPPPDSELPALRNITSNGSVEPLPTSPSEQKPEVVATWWRAQNTVCVGVTYKKCTVLRRMDNHDINGTKLLSVTSLSRGGRDKVLRREPRRQRVAGGAQIFRGIWLPFQRAYELALQYGIFELLLPLFCAELQE